MVHTYGPWHIGKFTRYMVHTYGPWHIGKFTRGNFTCRVCLFAPCTELQLCPFEFSWLESLNHYQSAIK